MALANFNIQVTFDLKDGIPNFDLTDANDYTGDGDTLVGGFIEIYGPDEELIYKTPVSPADFLPGQLTLDTVNIPTSVEDKIIPGTYRFVYTANTVNFPAPNGYTIDKSFKFEFCSPEIDITTELDCFIARFQSRDTTEYAVDGVVPNIVRVHEVFFPTELNKPNLSSNAELQEITNPNLFEGVHVVDITSDLIYSYPNEFKIVTEPTGKKSVDVQCDFNLCDLYCQIRALKQRLDTLRCENNTNFATEQRILAEIVNLMVLFDQAVKCGKNSDAEEYVAQMKKILGNQGSCSGECTTCNCPDGSSGKQIKPFSSAIISGTNKWISTVGTPSNAQGNDLDFAITDAGLVFEKTAGTWTLLLDLNGTDGINGTSSQWLSGDGPPAPALGNDTDLYLDTLAGSGNGDVYQKVSGAWTGPISNIIGPAGADGADGADSTVPGPPGADGTGVPIGSVVMYDGGDAAQFAIDFGGVNGLGVGLWIDWAHMNGLNGTRDMRQKFPVGFDSTNADYDQIGESGTNTTGFKSIQVNNLPSHNHSVAVVSAVTGITKTNQGAGDDGGTGGSTSNGHIHIIKGSLTSGGDFGTAPGAPGSARAGAGFVGDIWTTTDFSSGIHSHNINDPGHGHSVTELNIGSGDDIDIRPPYFAIPFVKKIA